MLLPTLGLESSPDRMWDVVVVGAGPAGAMAAYELAKQNIKLLLIDRVSFPRRKVCGSCLNRAALVHLQEAGLDKIFRRLDAPFLNELLLSCGKSQAHISLPVGRAVSREIFDTALVEEAVLKGADFLPETHACLETVPEIGFRLITLRQGERQVSVKAKVVLAADGLGGKFLGNQDGFQVSTEPSSRIGVSALFDGAADFYRRGKIYMVCGSHGYVGLVQVEGGRWNVAAALDREFLQESRGAGQAILETLKENRLPFIHGLEDALWLGTLPLTQGRTRVAGERIFVIGDSAGYVEPFTGEGIASALECARAVTEFVIEAMDEWRPELATRWNQEYRQLVSRRRILTRFIAQILRRRALSSGTVRLLSCVPALALPVVRELSLPFEEAWP